VLVHYAAIILQPQDHLVERCRNLEYSADFLAQGGHGARLQVALEIENKNARPPFFGFCHGLVTLFLGFRFGFPVGLVHHDLLQRRGKHLVFFVEVLDFETFLVAGLFSCRGGGGDDDDDCRHDGDCLEQEQAVIGEKLGHEITLWSK